MDQSEGNELGRRLKRLAKAAGYTAETLAEQLGCSPSAVWAWWAGRNEPSVDSLRAYARAVSVSVDYLVSGEDLPMGPVGTLREWRLRYAHLVAQGVDPAEAIDRISGPSFVDTPMLADSDLTAEERAILTGSADAMREVLEEIAATLDALGPHLPDYWETLTDRERRTLTRSLLRRVEVTVIRGKGSRGWQREVTAVEWQEWTGVK